jgi:hypothetical protein
MAGQVRGRGAVWSAGLVVALGAAAATAHGLYEVALASGTPAGVAWLYPVITDGLALVAYAASARLAGSARSYAWAVVVLAAGLSGLAQASFLAGGVAVAPPPLRFGVGAWPAVAAAIAAHLLFLISPDPRTSASATHDPTPVDRGAVDVTVSTHGGAGATPEIPVRSEELDGSGRDAQRAGVQLSITSATAGLDGPVSTLDADPQSTVSNPAVDEAGPREPRPAFSPIDRATAAAELHRRRTGALPTVRELESMAGVARGTAANALRPLRTSPSHLHSISETTEARPTS